MSTPLTGGVFAVFPEGLFVTLGTGPTTGLFASDESVGAPLDRASVAKPGVLFGEFTFGECLGVLETEQLSAINTASERHPIWTSVKQLRPQ